MWTVPAWLCIETDGVRILSSGAQKRQSTWQAFFPERIGANGHHGGYRGLLNRGGCPSGSKMRSKSYDHYGN